MEYRALGQTGCKVSALSLGASLGGMFRAIDEAAAIRTVHLALDLGINFIDVSPYYGLTKAEAVLGKALRGVARDRYSVATKVGRYGDAEFDFSARRVTASVDESLGRLGVDHIDPIQCHDIEFAALDRVIEETLPALEQVRAQGRARWIGITGLPLKIFRVVLARTGLDTILSYCHYMLTDTTLAGLIPDLQAQGVGIINASPLGMGLLTERGTPAWHPAPADIKAACEQAAVFCRSQGVDIAQLALQFSLAHPGIATTLVSTAEPENIAKNVRWIETPPDPALLAAVQAKLMPSATESGLAAGRRITDAAVRQEELRCAALYWLSRFIWNCET
jgi:L-galactose dehydrogenase